MQVKKKVIIIGAGFAGLQLTKALKNSHYEILVLDKYNFHQFQPLFYQVATARLEPSSITFPLRKLFRSYKNVNYRMAVVERVDAVQKLVHSDIGTFDYDILVIATGCTTNFFGNKNIESHAFPMKTATESLALSNQILLNFEDALKASGDKLESIMNMVVVGGGPTGVELAGSLAEMKSKVLPRDYPDMDFSNLNIFLLEGGPVTLAPMSPISQKKSQQYLEDLGVKVLTNTIVEDYDGETVKLQGGKTIKSRNLIWAAGVTGNFLEGLNITAQRGNRIKVDRYNRVEGEPDIYALGDIAYMETEKYPKSHPQVANVAINQAKNLGKNLKKDVSYWKQFEYNDPGTMATVGKRKAVVDLPHISFQGRLAWFTWMFLHLMLILSVRNKLFIFINWAISYFTNDTTLRIILFPRKKEINIVEKIHFNKRT